MSSATTEPRDADLSCPECSARLTRAILAQDGPMWMCSSCYARTEIVCWWCEGSMHKIKGEWTPRVDAGTAACPTCGVGMRITAGEPVWLDRDDDKRASAREASRRRSTNPPPRIEEEVAPPVSGPVAVERPRQLRKPKSFAREAKVEHAVKAGFRDSAEPERSVALEWESTTKRETSLSSRVALAALVILPTLVALGVRGEFVWLFVAAFAALFITLVRRRPEKLAKRAVRVRPDEIEIGDQVVPRVRVQGVEVRSDDEGLHQVVLTGAEVVVDETAKLEHALWIEEELKRELDAFNE